MINRPTIAMATIMPATAGTKYASTIDVNGCSVGAGAGGASITPKAASEYDGQ